MGDQTRDLVIARDFSRTGHRRCLSTEGIHHFQFTFFHNFHKGMIENRWWRIRIIEMTALKNRYPGRLTYPLLCFWASFRSMCCTPWGEGGSSIVRQPIPFLFNQSWALRQKSSGLLQELHLWFGISESCSGESNSHCAAAFLNCTEISLWIDFYHL